MPLLIAGVPQHAGGAGRSAEVARRRTRLGVSPHPGGDLDGEDRLPDEAHAAAPARLPLPAWADHHGQQAA